MIILPMDYDFDYDRDTLMRLADAGITDCLLPATWGRFEYERGHYEMDGFVAYLRNAKAAGIRMLVHPNGGPTWAPDDWHFKNQYGQYNECRDYILAEHRHPTAPYSIGAGYATTETYLSYWNPDAVAATYEYIRHIRTLVEAEGSTAMPWVGNGEYFMPAPEHVPAKPWQMGYWWFDDYAVRSWQQYRDEHKQPTREGWMLQEQLRVTKEQLDLYDDKWLQLVPYWRRLEQGTLNTAKILAANADGLRTLLFTVFHEPNWPAIAQRQASKYPTWCGCQGPYNLVKNARRAKKIGMHGVICGILWPDYGMTKIEPWVYANIREVIAEWNRP